MSSPTNPARTGSVSSDPAELRRDIEETRGEMAETVSALADKADIKSRTQDKAQQLKAQAMEKAQQLKAQAMERAPEMGAQASAKAQQLAVTARQKAQEKPAAAVGGMLAVLGLLILRRRRQRRKQPSDLTKLRWDIEALRSELADAVNTLTDNYDVGSWAQDKAQEFTTQATRKAQKLGAQAMEKAPKVRAQTSAKAHQLAGTAQQKARHAQQTVQDKPGIPVAAVGGAVLAVLGLLILRGRGR